MNEATLNLNSGTLNSGKGHQDENFPVASFMLKPEHRAPIMAFYRFARAADDIADHAGASAEEKLARLSAMRAGLDGAAGGAAEALALRAVMAERGLDGIHARELLDAFEQDVTVTRYADWDSLIGYCRKSAMPVGRYVLDVHGEDRARTWPANDALCAALQVINHLQDCGKDYRTIGRVYVPQEMLDAAGARIEDLGADRATPELRAAIVAAAERTTGLLATSAAFSKLIEDKRLSMEVCIIQRLAEDLNRRLLTRDPLSMRVHHSKVEAGMIVAGAVIGRIFGRRRG